MGGDQVEGRQAVRELLAAGRRQTREVLIADDLEPSEILAEIEDLAKSKRVRVRYVGRARLAALARTDAPQGVLAQAEPIPETDLEALCQPPPGAPSPFLVALDGLTDPQNVGALLRTAECSGATGVVLPRHRSAHVTPAVTKAAAGAIEHLSLALVAGLPAALARARDLGLWVVGLDAGGKRSLFDLEVATEPIVVVLGAEGAGLARLTRQRCELVVRIPLHGSLASLNVAAAGALACFEVARRRAGATTRGA